jgi:hypothetical protein
VAEFVAIGWDDVVHAASPETASPVCDAVGLLGLDDPIYRDPGSTAARVWTLVRQPIRVSEIRRVIVEETGRDVSTVSEGVLEALNDLRRAGLVEVVGGGRHSR